MKDNLVIQIRCRDKEQFNRIEKIRHNIKSRTNKPHGSNLEDAYNELIKELDRKEEMQKFFDKVMLDRRESLV